MFGLPLRKGYAMKINGPHLNRPDMHNIAAEIGVSTKDVLYKDGVLTVYNTTPECQEIIDDGALISFIAMALEISPEDIEEMQEVEEEPRVMEFDLDEFDEDEE